jgi:hypothetical protein
VLPGQVRRHLINKYKPISAKKAERIKREVKSWENKAFLLNPKKIEVPRALEKPVFRLILHKDSIKYIMGRGDCGHLGTSLSNISIY